MRFDKGIALVLAVFTLTFALAADSFAGLCGRGSQSSVSRFSARRSVFSYGYAPQPAVLVVPAQNLAPATQLPPGVIPAPLPWQAYPVPAAPAQLAPFNGAVAYRSKTKVKAFGLAPGFYSPPTYYSTLPYGAAGSCASGQCPQ